MQDIPKERDWLVYPENHKETFPPLPPSLLRILRRIRTDCCIFKMFPLICQCGKSIDYNHIFENCHHLDVEFRSLIEYSNVHKLKPKEFLVHNNSLGWSPAEILCQTIYKSSIGHKF